jgi:hypothetical protein
MRYGRRWGPLLLATFLALLSLSCASPRPAKPLEPDPPLPVRPSPRPSWGQVEAWILEGRVDLLAAELDRERAYVDAMIRDGRWAEPR